MTDIRETQENEAQHLGDGSWRTPYGVEVWVKNGRWHRNDGPAITYQNGDTYWYFHGWSYTLEQWIKANDETTDGKKLLLKLKYG